MRGSEEQARSQTLVERHSRYVMAGKVRNKGTETALARRKNNRRDARELCRSLPGDRVQRGADPQA